MLTFYIIFINVNLIEKQNFSLKYAAKRDAFCYDVLLTARYQRRLSFRPLIKLSKKPGA